MDRNRDLDSKSDVPASNSTPTISGIFRTKSQNPSKPSDRLTLIEIERLLDVFQKRDFNVIDIFCRELCRLLKCEPPIVHSDHVKINDHFESILETMIEENNDGTVTLFIPLQGYTIEIKLSEEDLKNLAEEKWKSFKILIKIAKQGIEREERLQLHTDIVASTMHDMANQISVVVANTSYVREREIGLDEDSTSALDEANSAALSAQRIASQSLTILVAERKALHLMKRETIDLSTLLNRVITRGGKKCNLIDRSVIRTLRGDAVHLERLLVNLIGNALKYASEKENPTLIIDTDGQCMIMKIVDRGPGVGQNPDRLFQYYVRASGDGEKVDGFGIGLAYCKLVCELHGGSIEAQNNEDGIGAIFTVKIPLL